MSDPVPTLPTPSELLRNLLKEGGRLAMYGGDPYEDDVEPEVPPASPPGASAACGSAR
jgi:hypothetical protein